MPHTFLTQVLYLEVLFAVEDTPNYCIGRLNLDILGFARLGRMIYLVKVVKICGLSLIYQSPIPSKPPSEEIERLLG